MPEELNRRVDHLADEVHGLREGVDAVLGELAEANERAERAETTSQRNRSWLRVLGISFVVSLIVSGVLFGGLFTFAMRNRTGQCTDWKATATQPIGPQTSDFGRSLVRTAADAYRLTGCEQFLGELGPVDPDAYRPAPPQPPSPSPSRSRPGG